MMESDYDLPSLHCYTTMNPVSDAMAPIQQQQQHQNTTSSTPSTIAPTPTSTTTSTSPPLKRTRAKRSCDFCRQRKSRCDADTCTPCTNCKAWGYTCEFQTVRKKRGPPSVYVDNLEKRCKKMEQLLMQLTNTTIKDLEQNDFRTTHRRAISDPSIVSDSSSDNDEDEKDDQGSSSYSPIAPFPPPQQQHDAFMTPCSSSTTTTTPLDDDDNEIIHRLGQLDIHDYDSIKYTGQSAGLELPLEDVFKSKPYIAWPGRRDTVLQRMADDQLMVVRTEKSAITGKLDTRLDVGISITSAPSSSFTTDQTNTIVNNNNDNKPPKALVTRMVTLFFTHLHPILPIINKIRFLHLYESDSPLLPKVLLQAMLAVSFRFAAQHGLFPTTTTGTGSTTIQSMAEQYADYFFRKVMKQLQESTRSRLCHVQAGLLATLYFDMWNHHQQQQPSANVESIQWQVLGKAIRMAQDLGLHRTCEHWQLPKSEIETRHRVFYACYVLDRWIGARAGKPLTILDRDFDTALPSMYEVVDHDHDAERKPVYRAFYLWIKLSEILGRVLKALYAPSAKKANSNANLDDPMILVVFDRRLKHWYALLEEPVDNTYLPVAQNASLQIYYNTVILLLRRPFLSTTSSFTVDEHLVTESRHISLQAALNIFQLIQQNKSQQPLDNNHRNYVSPSHLLPTCYVYAMFLSSLVHVAIVLHDRTSMKKRHALAASIGLMESHQHLCASRRALEILNMLVTIHEIKPSSPIDKNGDTNEEETAVVLGFKPIKLEQQSHENNNDDDPSYMLSNYNHHQEEDDDETLDPYYTTTAAVDEKNRTDTLAFHHHHPPPSSFDSHFITPCPPPSTTAPITTTTSSFVESEMPKSHWFQRFVNTSVVGGVPSEIQHDVASDLSHNHRPTSSYLCPPPPSSILTNNNNHMITTATAATSHHHHHHPPTPSSSTSMFYTPYMPSPPMPSSASPTSTSATDLHSYHHLPLLSSPSETPSSSAPHHLLFAATTTATTIPSIPSSAPPQPHRTHCSSMMMPPPPPSMPLSLHPSPQQPLSPSNLNWHDWQFYMHQHPPSSPLSK